jgi:dihydropyrimidine dehydrogenase (NAD+) subunit PreA
VACNDTAHQCIDLVSPTGSLIAPYAYDVRSNGKEAATETRPQPTVREEDCVGCRLCYNVCPVDQCISMVEVPSGREPVTWGELSEREGAVTEDWEAMKAWRERAGIHIH